MELSIIIVHYQTSDLTNACLKSIQEHADVEDYEILVVDNGSEIEFSFPEGFSSSENSIVRLNENAGYAGAVNEGIKKARSEYFLILNNDVEFIESGLKGCLKEIKEKPEIGAITCRLEHPDGTVQHNANRFPSISKEWYEFFRLQKFFGGKRILLGNYFGHDRKIFCDWVWGTFLICSKELVNSFPEKKFDDRFFLYFEDVVWGWQIKNQAKKVAFFPGLRVIHHLSKTTESYSSKKEDLIYSNEGAFLLTEKGKAYSFLLYLSRGLNHLSKPNKVNLRLAFFFFGMAFNSKRV